MSTGPELSGVETGGEALVRPGVGLGELARVFFVIGLTGFGGGMAIVALIRQVCVEQRRWMSDQEFGQGLALTQFLGAFAVNTTTFVGYRVRGLAGAIVAVLAFLTPGVALIIALSAMYYRSQNAAALQNALSGIGPVVVAILLSAAFGMGRSSVRSPETALIAALAFLSLAVFSAPVLVIVGVLALYGLGRHLVRARATA